MLGTLTQGEPLAGGALFGLAGLALCAHLFGFALNDLIDHPLDRTLPGLRSHPLVTGRLSRREAWAFTLIQPPLALGIYLLMRGAPAGFVALCLSIAFSVVYNLWSKRGAIPRFLPELALASSIGLLCLSGAWLTTPQISPGSIIFALTLTLVLLLLNSVSSGLKDIKTDAAFGARSFVLSTGSRMLDGDRMLISRQLWRYSAVLQTAILICFIALLVLFRPGWPSSVLIGVLGVYAGLHLRMLLTLPSFAAVRRSMPLLDGYYNYAALALFVVGQMPIALQVLYGLLILSLLLIPWRLSWRVWRDPYHALGRHLR